MKKKVTRLALERETIRNLRNSSLSGVGGGLISTEGLINGCGNPVPTLIVNPGGNDNK